MAPQSVKLYYFPLRARAEAIRLLLTYSGTKFEDIRIPMDEWPTHKAQMPMGQLPVLEVNGKKLSQSLAIARYVARENGLYGKTSWDMARVDMLVDGLVDLLNNKKVVCMAKMQGDQKSADEQWPKFVEDHMKPFLDRYLQFLKENGGQWFVGDSITWIDIAMTEFLSVVEDCFDKHALDKYPEMRQLRDKVLALPQLKSYVASRPQTPF